MIDIAAEIIAALEGPRGPEIARLVAKRASEDLRQRKPVDLDPLLRKVAAAMEITTYELRCRSVTAKVVTDARAVFAYLARKHTTATYARIGRELGGQDHSTIIVGEKRGARLVITNDLARECARNIDPVAWLGKA